MKIAKATEIKKTVGDKTLFNQLEFSISEGDRIGLIGINGTGKSTLLNIISEKDVADSGIIDKPKDYQIAYLEQQFDMGETENVTQYLFRNDSPLFKIVREYDEMLEKLKMDEGNQKLQNQLFALQEKMDSQNGWELHAMAVTILNKLGISNIHSELKDLSGGQKKRVALAKVLVEQPDLLILDEPTNHLDQQTIEWLQNHLQTYSKALLFVTHDRYFLDACSTKIWELANKELKEYKGNYQQYLESKAIQDEVDIKAAHKLKSLFKSELAWMRKGAKARTTKQKARIQRFDDIQQNYETRESTASLEIETVSSRLGKKVIEAKSISKSYGTKNCFSDFSVILQKGDRIGIIGENGVGKTTLLKVLTGELAPDSGELDFGITVKLGYYSQELDEMPEDKRMLQYLQESAETVVLKDESTVSAAQMLERFLFPPHSHGTIIGKLSGGERRRLYLLKVLMESPNVLFLDEPTNDLDIQTLTVLEDYLESFPGVVITVSHDRYFLDKTVDKLWVFDKKGKISIYLGSASDFFDWQKEQKQEEKKPIESEKSVRKQQQKKKLSYAETKEWESIDNDIARTEEEIADVQKRLQTVGSDFTLANDLLQLETKLNEKLEYLIERWSYLSEIVEGK
ncbi:MAG: family ATP-binding cassette protein [Bacillales bacterium]|jgi:ATP-binding cassette subfamily F protein uup|nr:family ATP-binding cassette protein [Bacillales bacterium]